MRTMKSIIADLHTIERGIREKYPRFADGISRIASDLSAVRRSADRDQRHHQKCRERQRMGMCYACGAPRGESGNSTHCGPCRTLHNNRQLASYHRRMESNLAATVETGREQS